MRLEQAFVPFYPDPEGGRIRESISLRDVRQADCKSLYPVRGHGKEPQLSALVSREGKNEEGGFEQWIGKAGQKNLG